MLPGIRRRRLSAVRVTIKPPSGASRDSCTVHGVEPPPDSMAELQESSSESAESGANKVNCTLLEEPLYEAVRVPLTSVTTPLTRIIKEAVLEPAGIIAPRG